MAVEVRDTPFTEAIGFFAQKARLPTRAWSDVRDAQHARAFVVAGAARDELLADLQGEIRKALESGTTLQDFRKGFDEIVGRHGWHYKGGRNWRTRTIFETNLRSAYNAGRWEQAQRLKRARPYLRYVSGHAIAGGEHSRMDHHAWHDTVLPVDHVWWRTHHPPNGWGCRCSVQSLSERDLERYGLRVSEAAPDVELETREINTPDGPLRLQVPAGIDTGFAHNPGLGASLRPAAGAGRWRPIGDPPPPGPLPRLPLDRPQARLGGRASPGDEGQLRRRLRDAIGGEEAVFVDPTGAGQRVGQGLVDHMLADPKRLDGREAFFPFLKELIEQPAEIWAAFGQYEGGRVTLRKRYVKALDLGRGRVLGLIAEAERGEWQELTFFQGDMTRLDPLRREARRIWSRED